MFSFRSLALSASATFLTLSPTWALAATSHPYDVVEQFAEVLSVVEDEYVEAPQREALTQGAIAGMVAALDPHSAYMTAEQYGEFKEDTSGRFAGLGIEVDLRNGQVIIVAPIGGSPAERAGLRSGDRIVALDGTPLEALPMAEIVRRMRGMKGTVAHLVLRRTGHELPIRINVESDDVSVPSVHTHMFEGHVAFVRIVAFQEGTHTELLSKMGNLISQLGQCRGLILDLRQNPGGLVAESIAVADEFLNSGLLFSTRHRGKVVERVETTAYGHFENIPMITLVDSGSASAAEIVAGAFKDRKRSLLVGDRTFGKGTVQSIIDVSGGAGLRLTSLRYYTPLGHGIQAAGIQPDTLVADQDLDAEPLRESDLPGHLPNERVSIAPPTTTDQAAPPNKDEQGCVRLKPIRTLAQKMADLPAVPTTEKDAQLALAYQLLLNQIVTH